MCIHWYYPATVSRFIQLDKKPLKTLTSADLHNDNAGWEKNDGDRQTMQMPQNTFAII